MTTVLQSSPAGNCGVKPANLPRPKPISVNGVTIPRAAISQEVQNHPADKPIEAWLKAARALVVRELLLQEARRLAVPFDAIADDEGRRETEDEALVRTLVEREVVTPDADEATCRRYYERHRAKFRSSPLFGVRHILCAAAPGDAEGRADARALAERIIAEIDRDPACFTALAQAHSACPSREVGGSLGQISRGQTVPEFEQALAGAPVGRVSGEPAETRYGFHVIFVDQHIDGEDLPFELVQSRIAEWLAESSRRTAIRQYIAMLAGRAEIKGIDLAATA